MIVGFFTAWGNADWAVRAIYNHLKIADEILVSVQAHADSMVRFGDDTFERIAIEFSDDPRVKIIPVVDVCGGVDSAKCAILNEMLKYTTIGDVVMLCDSDEFYCDGAVEEIKDEIVGDWDMLRVVDRFFCINMSWYVGSTHGRFWRIKQNAKFYPTQNMIPTPIKTKTILEKNPMFHYSILQNITSRHEFWKSEGRDMQASWLENIYKKWSVDADLGGIAELAEENYRLTGHRGFWFNGGVKEDEHQFLFRYDGDHPEEIEFSEFRNRKDFRNE